MDVLDAPGARVGVDEARPQPQHVDDRARPELQVELERGAARNRRHFGGRRAVDGRAAHRQPVQHQPPLAGVIMGVERRLLDRDRLFAWALRREYRVARLEMADPGGLSVRRRRRPTDRVNVGRAREKL